MCLRKAFLRLLCPWARHLTGCSHLYVEDRWPSFPSKQKLVAGKALDRKNKTARKCRILLWRPQIGHIKIAIKPERRSKTLVRNKTRHNKKLLKLRPFIECDLIIRFIVAKVAIFNIR